MEKRRSSIKRGDRVIHEGEPCQVLKWRRVPGLAMLQTSEYEVCLEAEDGKFVGWVGENEVTKISRNARGPSFLAIWPDDEPRQPGPTW